MMTDRMQTDWKAVAAARGMDVSEKVTAPLAALEAQFAALKPSIDRFAEPVSMYVLPYEGESK